RLRVALAPLAIVQLLTSLVARRRQPSDRPTRPPEGGHHRRSLPQSSGLAARLRAVLALAPPVTWRALTTRLPERTPAAGERRMTVGLLTGCVQRFVFS